MYFEGHISEERYDSDNNLIAKFDKSNIRFFGIKNRSIVNKKLRKKSCQYPNICDFRKYLVKQTDMLLAKSYVGAHDLLTADGIRYTRQLTNAAYEDLSLSKRKNRVTKEKLEIYKKNVYHFDLEIIILAKIIDDFEFLKEIVSSNIRLDEFLNADIISFANITKLNPQKLNQLQIELQNTYPEDALEFNCCEYEVPEESKKKDIVTKYSGRSLPVSIFQKKRIPV